MSGDAVRIEGLGVRYYLHYEKGPSGVQTARPGLIKRRGRRELWALRDIGLSIGRGEIFGIIGANGAGKSTLLKVLAGIIPPTEGSVEVSGILAPFIELGAAINPELTGAENIFLTGSIYRVPRREIRANFNRIVEFAELRNFIDTPVKNYSSGMFVRLAFSSILFFRPDILLVDEVFSVGDEAFQQKSFDDARRWGDGRVRIVSVTFVGRDGRAKTDFRTGEYFEARIGYESKLAGEAPVFGVAFATIYRLLINGPNTLAGPVAGEFRPSGSVRFIVPELPLLAGDYLFSASCYDRTLQTAYDHHELMHHFRVSGAGGREFGCVRIDSRWEFGEP
jgi:ABC-type polysaccharide/polyol phosphate transport system ATPase subunit